MMLDLENKEEQSRVIAIEIDQPTSRQLDGQAPALMEFGKIYRTTRVNKGVYLQLDTSS